MCIRNKINWKNKKNINKNNNNNNNTNNNTNNNNNNSYELIQVTTL